jgi:Phage integrase, N-terminal
MDKLNWDLRQICNRNKDGAFSTQAARWRSLDLMARELRALGFHNLRAGRYSLAGKPQASSPAPSRTASRTCAGGGLRCPSRMPLRGPERPWEPPGARGRRRRGRRSEISPRGGSQAV